MTVRYTNSLSLLTYTEKFVWRPCYDYRCDRQEAATNSILVSEKFKNLSTTCKSLIFSWQAFIVLTVLQITIYFVQRSCSRINIVFLWLVRSQCTFVRHLHYQRSKACSRRIFSQVPTSLTVSRVRAANIVWRPCSDSSHVTAPNKFSFYYFIIVISLDNI